MGRRAAPDAVGRRRAAARRVGRPRARHRARAGRRPRSERPSSRELVRRARCTIVRERDRASRSREHGDDCGGCGYVAACPAHPTGAHYGRRRDLLPGIVHAHADRPRHLAPVPPRLAQPVPALDPGERQRARHRARPAGARRAAVRPRARLVPRRRPRRRRARRARLRRPTTACAPSSRDHARRCPDPRGALGHEITRRGSTASRGRRSWRRRGIDALWVHDGVLDARDYKTGQVWSDQRRPTTARRGSRRGCSRRSPRRAGSGCGSRSSTSRPTCVEDPEPFEPDADDLRAIEEELRADGRARCAPRPTSRASPTPTCADPAATARSAPTRPSPGVPVWPMVEAEDGRHHGRVTSCNPSHPRPRRRCSGGAPPSAARAAGPDTSSTMLHDRRRLPAVRAALRARGGLLGRRARDQHRPHRRGVHRRRSSSRSCSPRPTSRWRRCSPILVPLMIAACRSSATRSRRPIWVAVDRALAPAPRPDERLDEQMVGFRSGIPAVRPRLRCSLHDAQGTARLS